MGSCWKCLSILFLFIRPIVLPAQQTVNSVPVIFEKVYLHTDRDLYAAGDTLWFKAYLVNPQEGRPGGVSNNLHVELLSPEATIVRSVLIRLDKGFGHGDLDLGDSIPPGAYRLRAYSNWMRNFGANFVFEKSVTIAGETKPDIPVAAKASGKNQALISETALPAHGAGLALTFYPEGGSLVEGVLSRVAVKARGPSGHGIPASGSILSSQGDTVANFHTDSLGFGLFALSPVKGLAYRAVLKTGNTPSFSLPAALSAGPVLMTRQTDSLLRVVISSVGDTTKRPYLLVVRHSGKAVLSKNFSFSTQTSIAIPSSLLQRGVSSVTLYQDDGNKRPLCERLVYIHGPDTIPLLITTDKKAYRPGEKITLSLKGAPNTNLSMSVVDAGLVPPQAGDIASYLLLESELRGAIEQVNRYFDTTNVNRFEQLDLLLMTQGWRDFVWRRMADTAIRISYEPENGVYIAGKVKIEDGKALPGLNISLYATAAKGVKLFSDSTDSEGRFRFSGVEYYGSQPIKLAATNNKGVNKGTFYLDTLSALPAFKLPATFSGKEPDSVWLGQFTNALALGKARSPLPKNPIALKEVKLARPGNVSLRSGMFTPWGPDQVFNISPADKPLRTLEWYLLQRAKGAQRFNDPDPEKQVTGPVFPGYGIFAYRCLGLNIENPEKICYRLKSQLLVPVLFVNGRELLADEPEVAEEYRNIYYKMPITKFKQIVLRKVSGRSHNAPPEASHLIEDRYILYLTLTEEAMFGDNSGVLNRMLDGYTETQKFYEPLTGEQALQTPFRATLNWKPDLSINGNGTADTGFFATAQKTTLTVFVQGLTPEGKPVAGMAHYEVR